MDGVFGRKMEIVPREFCHPLLQVLKITAQANLDIKDANLC